MTVSASLMLLLGMQMLGQEIPHSIVESAHRLADDRCRACPSSSPIGRTSSISAAVLSMESRSKAR